ncbi:MAG: hypothetical protein ACK5YB_15175, partial [Burkholderiales bacterium]
DLNGIGPEVIFRMFQDNRLFQTGLPVLFGPGKSLHHYKKQYFQGEPGLHEIQEPSEAGSKNLCFISSSDEDFKPQAGVEPEVFVQFDVSAYASIPPNEVASGGDTRAADKASGKAGANGRNAKASGAGAKP